MSAIRINDIPLFQVDLPSMTLAQYNALPEADRPKHWIRTDLEYRNIPASMVDLSNGQTVEQAVNKGSVSVTTDGVKTNRALLDELYALIDKSKLTSKSTLTIVQSNGAQSFLTNAYIGANYASISFATATIASNLPSVLQLDVKASSSKYCYSYNNTFVDESTTVPTSGAKFRVDY